MYKILTRQFRRAAFACLLLTTSSALGLASEAVFPLGSPGRSVRIASAFPGADIGAQLSVAYADLPASGGAIMVTESGSFSTPIVFGANNKPVLLVGLPGDIGELNYTGENGTAITFDYGRGHRMGHGLRDLL